MTKPMNTNTPHADRLIDFRTVADLVGSRCKSAHCALRLAAKGQIRAVRINARTVRYSENSVNALISGKAHQ